MHFTANEVPLAERESKLWEASRQYMRGNIELEDLEEVERKYALPLDATRVQAKTPLLKEKRLKQQISFLYLKKLWKKLWLRFRRGR